MKYTLVTETYPPDVNGVAMTLERLVGGLHLRGNEVVVVTPYPKNRPRTVPESKNARRYGVTGFPIPGYPDMQFGRPAMLKLRGIFQKERPDVVHIATEGPLGLSAWQAANQLKIPCISTFHTNFQIYSGHYGFGWLRKASLGYLRWLHNRTLATFAPSMDVLKQLQLEGFKNLHILGRGVDTELFGPARRSAALREQWGVAPEDPVVIYVGRIAAEKNIPLTLRAFREFSEIHPKAKLVLVGDGPEKARLEKENPDFVFAGIQRGEALAAHYASADLFFFASTTETFGNVVTEGMASCLVVAAFDYAAPLQYIRDCENGFKAPFADEAAFLATIQKLARQPERWADVQAAARQTAEALSWDQIIEQFEKDITALIEPATKSR